LVLRSGLSGGGFAVTFFGLADGFDGALAAFFYFTGEFSGAFAGFFGKFFGPATGIGGELFGTGVGFFRADLRLVAQFNALVFDQGAGFFARLRANNRATTAPVRPPTIKPTRNAPNSSRSDMV